MPLQLLMKQSDVHFVSFDDDQKVASEPNSLPVLHLAFVGLAAAHNFPPVAPHDLYAHGSPRVQARETADELYQMISQNSHCWDGLVAVHVRVIAFHKLMLPGMCYVIAWVLSLGYIGHLWWMDRHVLRMEQL